MIIMIDNYDSFTYNLYQYIGTINPNIEVYRNDRITVNEILSKNPEHIILSPGPGRPETAGICTELILKAQNIPILGVCLGHQAIGQAFGAKIIHAPQIIHGKSDNITIDSSCPIFKDFDSPISAGRYHSLIIDRETLPKEIEITAETKDKVIMGIEHRNYPIYGVQFHPEAELTEEGHKLLNNFIMECKNFERNKL